MEHLAHVSYMKQPWIGQMEDAGWVDGCWRMEVQKHLRTCCYYLVGPHYNRPFKTALILGGTDSARCWKNPLRFYPYWCESMKQLVQIFLPFHRMPNWTEIWQCCVSKSQYISSFSTSSTNNHATVFVQLSFPFRCLVWISAAHLDHVCIAKGLLSCH